MDEDIIEVYRRDLEMWANALFQAHNFSMANDLVAGYKDLRPEPKKSKLTNVLARSFNQLESYLTVEDEDVEDTVGQYNLESPREPEQNYPGESYPI